MAVPACPHHSCPSRATKTQKRFKAKQIHPVAPVAVGCLAAVPASILVGSFVGVGADVKGATTHDRGVISLAHLLLKASEKENIFGCCRKPRGGGSRAGELRARRAFSRQADARFWDLFSFPVVFRLPPPLLPGPGWGRHRKGKIKTGLCQSC